MKGFICYTIQVMGRDNVVRDAKLSNSPLYAMISYLIGQP